MKKSFKITLGILLGLGVCALTLFYITSHNVAVLNPKGSIGMQEKDLIITASALMMIIVIPVFILTLYFSWKYREDKEAKHTPDWEHNYIAEYCWWGVPLIIVSILAVLTWKSTHKLNPFKPLDSEVKPIEIQVVALQWKWLFIYPGQGIATVNYLQIPEKTPINFQITSDAPMNSFWIPELGGQIYAMPAMRSKLHLIADQTGTFRGVSSSISGKGFAGMHFPVIASTTEEFNQWVSQAKRSSNHLDFQSYKEIAKPSENLPATLYNLTDPKLFDEVMDQYLVPEKTQ